ncbi:MAG: hypothetical protein JXA46_07240 [Dehalococcoidales bacterium]|nr:hypothetical protein [Dehalococcoidales bacterium]
MVNKNFVLKHRPDTLICNFCGSHEVVKYGFTEKGKQRHLCLNCKHTFLDNDVAHKKRYPTKVIASAIKQFYEGKSLHEIQRQLDIEYNAAPHYSSIYDWIFHYTKKAKDTLDSIKLRTGDNWVTGETVVKLRSTSIKDIRIFDCIDKESGFLLASHLILNQNRKEMLAFVKTIIKYTRRRNPQYMDANRLESLLQSFQHDYTSNKLPRMKYPLNSDTVLKRLRGTLKERSNIIRSLTNLESINLVMNGWCIHYNFFRPHPGLNGQTPADAAKLNVTSKSWADIINDSYQAVPVTQKSIKHHPHRQSGSKSYAGFSSS